MDQHDVDAVIIGAGIAGASLAACLPDAWRVAIVERESQPGFHSTGRSAAIFSEVYGAPSVRALSRATRPLLAAPPAAFAEHALMERCGVLFIANADQLQTLDALAAALDVRGATASLGAAEVLGLVPALRRGYVAAGLLEPAAACIDVHGLHHGFLRQARARGAALFTGAGVRAIERVQGLWQVETEAGTFRSPRIVNAAGAWVDEIARLAGVPALGIQPLRRTAVLVDAEPAMPAGGWPFTVDVDETFYFKPDSGRLLLSPADETLQPPCDVQPDEYDVALAIHRVEEVTNLTVRRVVNKWAGLRSFAPDRNLVIGIDPRAEGFFWLAGQGGYGIQTSYGAATLAAGLLTEGRAPQQLLDYGLVLDEVTPGRLIDLTPTPLPHGEGLSAA